MRTVRTSTRTRCGVWTALVAALLCLLPAPAKADGLRVGASFALLNYPTSPGQNSVTLLYSSLSARVSRGRAGMTFAVPMLWTSGGNIAVSDDTPRVHAQDGMGGSRFGLGDLAMGLDYNLYQNRAKMIIVTLGGSLRVPSARIGLGSGDYVMGLGLSAVYGITKQLMAFGDVRQSWLGLLSPTVGQVRMGELGLIYWFTQKMGLSGSFVATDFLRWKNLKPSLEFNLGLTYELFPGVMTNLGGIGGLMGSAPRGVTFGFGFEI